MTWRFYVAAVICLLVGMFGAFGVSIATHLYQDHLQVDQWRQEILQNQLRQLQQARPTPSQ